jgi:methylenetetrahydrofolate dehydrogenase (NADP+)/methenyltetrahydrofolate cyclohydrolase
MKLKGYEIANEVKEELKKRSSPSGELAIVRVGDDPVTSIYVEKKLALAEELNIKARVINTTKQDIFRILEELNLDRAISGIIVQLPLPDGLKREEIGRAIDITKDVDGFHYILNDRGGLSIPPTVLAINSIFEKYQVDLSSGVLIVGGGFLVGIPLKKYLEEKKIEVEILEKDDPRYEEKLKKASVLVIATGGGRSFNQDEFSQNSVVIDASTVSDEKKIRGDVKVEDDLRIKLAPVPGGVGPVTVAMLFKNFYDLSK